MKVLSMVGRERNSIQRVQSPEAAQQFFENQQTRWFTTKEAASFLRVSEKRLLNLTSNGKIPYYKFGRSNRYLESELKKLLLSQPKGVFYGD